MLNFAALEFDQGLDRTDTDGTHFTEYSQTSLDTATSNSCVGDLSCTSLKSKLGSFANCPIKPLSASAFNPRDELRTRSTLSAVCSPGPVLSKSVRSLTEPLKGIRMILR